MAMKTSIRDALIAATTLALCFSAPAIAKPPAQHDTPVTVHFDAPNSNYDLPLVSEEGWSLKLKITVPYTSIDFENGGLPRPLGTDGFPARQDFGWIFLENPDGCYRTTTGDLLFRSVGIFQNLSDYYCDQAEVVLDDIYIEYHADVDQVGVEDTVYGLPVDPERPKGRADLRELLVYSEGSRAPEFSSWKDGVGLQDCDPGTNDPEGCVRLGPAVSSIENTSMGGEVLDGWGFGTDDDLPGLFMYTEKGAGLIWQEPAFELAPGAGVRNLAGMANSVSYEVSDLMKVNKSSDPAEEFKIWVDFNVLAKTFQSFVQVDTNGLTFIPGQLWRFDGGAIQDFPLDADSSIYGTRTDEAAVYLMKNQVFTVKAFMVSGDAPPALFDTDGDGDYVDEAEAAGYLVLSNVAEISFLQIPDLNRTCRSLKFNAVFDDLDGDDRADSRLVCPRGAGALRDPPR
jgi:hypothetical protein